MALNLSLLDTPLAVCRLPHDADLPALPSAAEFLSVTRTGDELSLVIPEGMVPDDAVAESGWRAFKVAGPLEFSLLGILASLSATFANAGVSIFAVSTYDTDYVLCKKDHVETAINALRDAGHTVEA